MRAGAVECFLPEARRRRRIGRGKWARVGSVYAPLLPGYLFLRNFAGLAACGFVTGADGFVTLAGSDRPALLSDADLACLFLVLDDWEAQIKPGSIVEISCGSPWDGMSGPVLRVDKSGKITVQIAAFGSVLPIEIEKTAVTPDVEGA